METNEPHAADTMTPIEMAGLVDAAFRSPQPLEFLDTVQGTFGMLGRNDDAAAVFWLAYLFEIDEVEALLRLRAAWRRGFTRNPADVARYVVSPHG